MDRFFDSKLMLLRDIAKYEVLTIQQQGELARRAKEGDAAARQKLINHSLRIILSVMQRYHNLIQHLDFLDLFQKCVIGLMRSIEKYDPAEGTSFSTYAFHGVEISIKAALSLGDSLIRQPLYFIMEQKKARRTKKELIHLLGEENFTHDQLATKLGCSKKQLRRALKPRLEIISLEDLIEDHYKQIDRIAYLADKKYLSPLQKVIFKEELISSCEELAPLVKAVKRFSSKKQAAFFQREGLNNDGKKATFEEIARKRKVARQGVQEMVCNAWKTLEKLNPTWTKAWFEKKMEVIEELTKLLNCEQKKVIFHLLQD